ncbi:MAG: MAPEG family protein [Pseudomonadota bacterium]
MTEIHWLAATAIMTGLFWMSYATPRFFVWGIPATLGNPRSDLPALPAWAKRAEAAHKNATENLVVFAPLAIGVVMLGLSSASTITLCSVYFFARFAHFVIYVMGIPVARTLAFAAAWLVTMLLGLTILGLL